MKKYKVILTAEERSELEAIAAKGSHKSQKVINSLILLNVDNGPHQATPSKNKTISQILKVSDRKIDRVKKRCVEEGLDVALNGQPSSRQYEKKVDGDFEAHLVALSCSEPPEGYARWSLRILADKVVELEYIDSISHETIRRVLKKTKSNPGKN